MYASVVGPNRNLGVLTINRGGFLHQNQGGLRSEMTRNAFLQQVEADPSVPNAFSLLPVFIVGLDNEFLVLYRHRS